SAPPVVRSLRVMLTSGSRGAVTIPPAGPCFSISFGTASGSPRAASGMDASFSRSLRAATRSPIDMRLFPLAARREPLADMKLIAFAVLLLAACTTAPPPAPRPQPQPPSPQPEGQAQLPAPARRSPNALLAVTQTKAI